MCVYLFLINLDVDHLYSNVMTLDRSLKPKMDSFIEHVILILLYFECFKFLFKLIFLIEFHLIKTILLKNLYVFKTCLLRFFFNKIK